MTTLNPPLHVGDTVVLKQSYRATPTSFVTTDVMLLVLSILPESVVLRHTPWHTDGYWIEWEHPRKDVTFYYCPHVEKELRSD